MLLIVLGMIATLNFSAVVLLLLCKGHGYYSAFDDGWECCYNVYKVDALISPEERKEAVNSRLKVLVDEKSNRCKQLSQIKGN